MNIKLLTEHHLEILSLKGDCTGLSGAIHVKMSHCWTSHVAAQFCSMTILFICKYIQDSKIQNLVKYPNGVVQSIYKVFYSLISKMLKIHIFSYCYMFILTQKGHYSNMHINVEKTTHATCMTLDTKREWV